MRAIGNKWHPIFTIVRKLIKVFYPKYKVEGKENIRKGNPVVFICNHLDILGPTVIALFFPFRCRPWVIDKMIRIKTCMRYLENDFVRNVIKIKKKLLGRIVAFALALICTRVMRSGEAIPTYRDSYKAKLTFDKTEESILKGQNIIIFPEKDNIPFSEHINDFYRGFAHLGKKIFKDTGIELDYHPVFIDKIRRRIIISKAERFNGRNNFNEEKERIVETVRDVINKMAVEANEEYLDASNF